MRPCILAHKRWLTFWTLSEQRKAQDVSTDSGRSAWHTTILGFWTFSIESVCVCVHKQKRRFGKLNPTK